MARGDTARAIELASRGVAVAGNRRELTGLAHAVLGDLALFGGHIDRAVGYYESSADGFAHTHPGLAPYLKAAAALALAYGGRHDQAMNKAAAAMAEANRSACPTVQAFAHYAAAEACADDDNEHAALLLREAMTIASTVEAGFVATLARLTLANLTARQGDRIAALAHYPAIMQEWRRTDQWPQLWNTIRTLVPILTDVAHCIDAAMLLSGLRANQAATTWGTDADALTEADRKL